MSRLGLRLMGHAAVVITAIAFAHIASAQTWVGSTGAVDESSRSIYLFTGQAAYVSSSVSSGTVTLRYNIVPAPPLNEPIDVVVKCWSMGVRFIDNGNAARVTVALKRYNAATNSTTTLLFFDSNTWPQSSSFANGNGSSCGFFNFTFLSSGFGDESGPESGGDSVYYFEAKLTRTAAGGNPALAAIWLKKFNAQ